MPKTLPQLFMDFPLPCPSRIPDVELAGIAIDSRAVKPGYLFVAMKGGTADGHDYIQKAIDNGAIAVVGEKDINPLPVPYIRLENTRRSLTWLAGAFYDGPGRRLTVIGVSLRPGPS